MNVSESALATLPLPDQLFTVVNEERIDRGLPPIDYMTAQLDSYAWWRELGDGSNRPLHGDRWRPITFGGSFSAGGLSSPLEADYYWMYQDGWGGASTRTRPARRADRRAAGTTATSSCTSSATAPRDRRSSPWERPTAPGRSPGSWSRRAHHQATSRSPGLGRVRRLSHTHGRHRAVEQRHRLLGGRGRRHRRRFRLGAELRVGARPAQLADRRHGRHAERAWLLAGGRGRWHLQLRERQVLRVDGRVATQQADRGHGLHTRRRGLLDGGVRRGHLQLR